MISSTPTRGKTDSDADTPHAGCAFATFFSMTEAVAWLGRGLINHTRWAVYLSTKARASPHGRLLGTSYQRLLSSGGRWPAAQRPTLGDPAWRDAGRPSSLAAADQGRPPVRMYRMRSAGSATDPPQGQAGPGSTRALLRPGMDSGKNTTDRPPSAMIYDHATCCCTSGLFWMDTAETSRGLGMISSGARRRRVSRGWHDMRMNRHLLQVKIQVTADSSPPPPHPSLALSAVGDGSKCCGRGVAAVSMQ